MMMRNSLMMRLLLALVMLLHVGGAAVADTDDTASGRSCFAAIYSFGDSFADTGNADMASPPYNLHFRSLPYGKTFFGLAAGRASDGRLVIDFLASSLGFNFLRPSIGLIDMELAERKNGLNFAVAGATALDNSFLNDRLIFPQTPLSLDTQIRWFHQLKNFTCRANLDCQVHFSRALYVMGGFGLNDYLDSTFTSSPSDEIRGFTPLIIAKIQKAIQALIEEGAQYIFVQGMPPLGCLPAILTIDPYPRNSDYDENGCLASYNQLSQDHNTALQETLEQLRIQYPHAILVYADYYNMFMEIIKNHAAYGFTANTFQSCCGTGELFNFDIMHTCGTPGVLACSNPERAMSWDGIHFTEAAYKIISEFIINKAQYTQPPFSDMIKISGNGLCDAA
eukprot:PITA_23314